MVQKEENEDEEGRMRTATSWRRKKSRNRTTRTTRTVQEVQIFSSVNL